MNYSQVKAIQNRRFNQTSHNYELGLNQNTVVVECKASSSDVPNVHYEFVKLNELDNKPENDLVDVIGVCSAVEDVKEVKLNQKYHILRVPLIHALFFTCFNL